MADRSIEDIVNEVRLSHFGGDRSLFPPVLCHTAGNDSFRLSLDIQSELAWFRGHFPGNPVLAGVVQLTWAVAIAQVVFDISEPPGEVLRLKFKSVVVPPCTIDLTLTRPGPADVRFEFTGAGRQYSLGQLRFAGVS